MTGGGYRDGRGTTCGTDRAEREKTAGIATTATVTGGRRHTVDLLELSKHDGEGGEYCAGGRSIEKSADESAEWTGEEMEESASEEEAETAEGTGKSGMPLTVTAG